MKPVTVRQLIRQLLTQDMDAVVQVSNWKGQCFDIYKTLEKTTNEDIPQEYVLINFYEECGE